VQTARPARPASSLDEAVGARMKRTPCRAGATKIRPNGNFHEWNMNEDQVEVTTASSTGLVLSALSHFV
jgi:hypothetical protein